MNWNVLLGRDFLQENGVRIYFDMASLIKGIYVLMEQDIHVPRLCEGRTSAVLRTHTATVYNCKVKNRGQLTEKHVQILAISTGYLSRNPVF